MHSIWYIFISLFAFSFFIIILDKYLIRENTCPEEKKNNVILFSYKVLSKQNQISFFFFFFFFDPVLLSSVLDILQKDVFFILF